MDDQNSIKSTGFRLIDRPIGPFSSPEEIQAWIEQLKKWPKSPEVILELEYAESLLNGERRTASNLDEFKLRLRYKWLPEFCADEKRQYDPAGFKNSSIKISEFDAKNFIRALDEGLVNDSGGGRYRCHRSSAFEQIFWNGSKSIQPTPLWLWIEPVITIGTIARLGLDYSWPAEALCNQPAGWAFDFAVFKSESSENEYIAGEVKKTKRELDELIRDLTEFGRLGLTECDSDHPKRVNSFKKWNRLQECRAPFFWAVGPNDYTHLFSVNYGENHTAVFTEVPLDRLGYK